MLPPLRPHPTPKPGLWLLLAALFWTISSLCFSVPMSEPRATIFGTLCTVAAYASLFPWITALIGFSVHLAPNRWFILALAPFLVLAISVFLWLSCCCAYFVFHRDPTVFLPAKEPGAEFAQIGKVVGICLGIFASIFWFIWPRHPAPDRVHCLQCGYNLRGSRLSDRCPECGREVRRGQDVPLHPELDDRALDELVSDRSTE